MQSSSNARSEQKILAPQLGHTHLMRMSCGEWNHAFPCCHSEACVQHMQATCTLIAHSSVLINNNHQTISDAAQAVLISADLPIKFWSHCPLPCVCIFNSSSIQGQTASLIETTTNRKQDQTHLRTFTRGLWAQPPGRKTTS